MDLGPRPKGQRRVHRVCFSTHVECSHPRDPAPVRHLPNLDEAHSLRQQVCSFCNGTSPHVLGVASGVAKGRGKAAGQRGAHDALAKGHSDAARSLAH